GFDYYFASYSDRSSGLTMTYDPTTGNGTITIGSEVDTLISIESFNAGRALSGGFEGTDFNDFIVGTSDNENDIFYGLNGNGGDDTVSGGAGDDLVRGGEGNDVVNGDAGNDELYGENNNDTLQGTNNGIGEQDYLVGGTGNDRFILADTTKTFYDDGNITLPGDNDYATIADFNTTDDIIQLQGSSSNYLLLVSGSNTNLYINKPGSEPDELIAVINNQTALSLTASYFSYVSSPTLPSIALAVSPESVAEDGTTNLIYTFSRTGATTTALTVNYTVAGTATLGTDYTGIAATPAVKTVTFAANSATATVTVDPTADTTIEPDETVALTLATGTGYSIGTSAAVVGTILNDDVSSTGTYYMGAAESSLLLLGTKRINGIGNNLDNTIVGNSGNNRILGLLGADVLTGGGSADSDLFAYSELSETLLGTGNSFDIITDFNNRDRLLAPLSVETDRLVGSIGNVASLSASTIVTLLNTTTFAANSVAAFTVNGRTGTFIAMNDSRDGYQLESDAVLFLQNYAVSPANYVDFA
ncbi:MAG: bluetail domain-containing putative surface protein, partial [Sphaerospermopsis kisseleviana]